MNEKRQILTAAQVRALLPVLAVLLLLLAAGLAWTGWQQTQDAKRSQSLEQARDTGARSSKAPSSADRRPAPPSASPA